MITVKISNQDDVRWIQVTQFLINKEYSITKSESAWVEFITNTHNM